NFLQCDRVMERVRGPENKLRLLSPVHLEILLRQALRQNEDIAWIRALSSAVNVWRLMLRQTPHFTYHIGAQVIHLLRTFGISSTGSITKIIRVAACWRYI